MQHNPFDLTQSRYLQPTQRYPIRSPQTRRPHSMQHYPIDLPLKNFALPERVTTSELEPMLFARNWEKSCRSQEFHQPMPLLRAADKSQLYELLASNGSLKTSFTPFAEENYHVGQCEPITFDVNPVDEEDDPWYSRRRVRTPPPTPWNGLRTPYLATKELPALDPIDRVDSGYESQSKSSPSPWYRDHVLFANQLSEHLSRCPPDASSLPYPVFPGGDARQTAAPQSPSRPSRVCTPPASRLLEDVLMRTSPGSSPVSTEPPRIIVSSAPYGQTWDDVAPSPSSECGESSLDSILRDPAIISASRYSFPHSASKDYPPRPPGLPSPPHRRRLGPSTPPSDLPDPVFPGDEVAQDTGLKLHVLPSPVITPAPESNDISFPKIGSGFSTPDVPSACAPSMGSAHPPKSREKSDPLLRDPAVIFASRYPTPPASPLDVPLRPPGLPSPPPGWRLMQDRLDILRDPAIVALSHYPSPLPSAQASPAPLRPPCLERPARAEYAMFLSESPVPDAPEYTPTLSANPPVIPDLRWLSKARRRSSHSSSEESDGGTSSDEGSDSPIRPRQFDPPLLEARSVRRHSSSSSLVVLHDSTDVQVFPCSSPDSNLDEVLLFRSARSSASSSTSDSRFRANSFTSTSSSVHTKGPSGLNTEKARLSPECKVQRKVQCVDPGFPTLVTSSFLWPVANTIPSKASTALLKSVATTLPQVNHKSKALFKKMLRTRAEAGSLSTSGINNADYMHLAGTICLDIEAGLRYRIAQLVHTVYDPSVRPHDSHISLERHSDPGSGVLSQWTTSTSATSDANRVKFEEMLKEDYTVLKQDLLDVLSRLSPQPELVLACLVSGPQAFRACSCPLPPPHATEHNLNACPTCTKPFPVPSALHHLIEHLSCPRPLFDPAVAFTRTASHFASKAQALATPRPHLDVRSPRPDVKPSPRLISSVLRDVNPNTDAPNVFVDRPTQATHLIDLTS